MNHAYNLSGGMPVVIKYKVNETMSVAGVPVLVAAANGAGLALASTTGAADAVGVTVDTATYSTTPSAGAEGVVSVIVNPDAVYRIRVNDGATAGTQLAIMTESAGGSKTDNTITTGDDAPNSPEMDEGMILCVTGANAGQSRKITSTAATVATVTVGWYNNNAAGDVYILIPWVPLDVAADNVNLTSNLAEARQDIAVGTGADLRVMDIGFDLGRGLSEVRLNSYIFAVLDDHVLNTAT